MKTNEELLVVGNSILRDLRVLTRELWDRYDLPSDMSLHLPLELVSEVDKARKAVEIIVNNIPAASGEEDI